jgi:Flp pilus assembly pilin Flp
MKNRWQTFHADESGAITVDWVVLSAAVVALMFLIMATIGGAAEGHANWLQNTMANMM